MGKPNDLVHGTLELSVLKTIAPEPKHGWAIAKRIQQILRDVLQVRQGSLYPALHRLEQKPWIRRRAHFYKFYLLIAAGRVQLENEAANWDRLSSTINPVAQTS